MMGSNQDFVSTSKKVGSESSSNVLMKKFVYGLFGMRHWGMLAVGLRKKISDRLQAYPNALEKRKTILKCYDVIPSEYKGSVCYGHYTAVWSDNSEERMIVLAHGDQVSCVSVE